MMTERLPEPILRVEDLCVDFASDREIVRAVDHVTFDVGRSEVMGLVGESGSGKSTVARSIIGLLRPPGSVVGGRIILDGQDLAGLSEHEWRDVRGRKVAMVFQDALSALNPTMRVGEQVAEAFMAYGASHRTARQQAIEYLEMVEIPSARSRANHYPHEFSGGMRQRVVIAIALANSPGILLADEPTSALDVTVQAQLLQLLRLLSDEMKVATLLITHDLGAVAELCDRVTVMRNGEVVERGDTVTVLTRPSHDYSKMLLRSVPRIDGPLKDRSSAPASPDDPTGLEVSGLCVNVAKPATLLSRHRPVFAVDGVSLTLRPSETLGLVGESGCGKSTLSRALTGLANISAGSVLVDGRDVTQLPVGHPDRRAVQYVFQDPYGSLNPLRTVRQSLSEARDGEHSPTPEQLVARVRLSQSTLERLPSALSGGQRQRVGIARALAAEPEYLLCDEPVSALDVSIQAEIVALFEELRDDLGIGLLFIAHDLSVVRQTSHRVAVMFAGKVVESGHVRDIYGNPQHPYTVALLSAVPSIDPQAARERIILRGDPPAPGADTCGCRFASRCPIGPSYRSDRARCLEEEPPLSRAGQQMAACHFPGELSIADPGYRPANGPGPTQLTAMHAEHSTIE